MFFPVFVVALWCQISWNKINVYEEIFNFYDKTTDLCFFFDLHLWCFSFATITDPKATVEMQNYDLCYKNKLNDLKLVINIQNLIKRCKIWLKDDKLHIKMLNLIKWCKTSCKDAKLD